MKTIIKLAITALATFALVGCSGSPKPSVEGAKPTIYVVSHTAEKFKDVTEATAMWNGLSRYFVKDKSYMRCDMTQELMVTLVHYDFEIVTDPKDADYTMETTLLSCGSGYGRYIKNKSELPLQERALYKDFMRWVDETESSKLPKDAKEIASLIRDNSPEGFERFNKEDYIWLYGNKFDYTAYWQVNMRQDANYIARAKVALPSKYSKMSDEDKKILEEIDKKYKAAAFEAKTDHSFSTGSMMATKGFNMMSGGGLGGPSGAVGGAGAVIGLIMMFGGVTEPDVRNLFKITNNRTGKSWSMIVRSGHQQTWDINIKKPIDDWFVDEIPWSDLD